MYSNNENNKSGFKMLVNYQRITGQSYLFWNFGQRMGLSLKLILLFFNSLTFIAILYFTYMGVRDIQHMNNNIFFSSHHILIPTIMQISLYIFVTIINVYVFLLIQFKGKSILIYFNDLDIDIDSKLEKKIGIKAIVIQFSLTILLTLLFFFCSGLFNDIQNNILFVFIYFVITIYNLSNYLNLLTIMAYFCYLVHQRLTDLQNEFSSLQQLPKIFKHLLVIQQHIKKLDQYYNKYIFILIIFYSFECISNLTILYFDRYTTMFCPIPAIFESLISIFMFCYLSDKIDKTYVSIINKYEQLQLKMHDTQLSQFNHCLVSRLYSMRDDMCFTAFNLYPINLKTFMSILSMIITFTVILIQTRY